MMLVGAVFGAAGGGWLTDRVGRKVSILYCCLLFIVGALIMALAPSLGVLLAGRFVVGIGVALSAIADIVYIAEIAPPSRRGALVTLNELSITVGILGAYSINAILAETAGGWRWMFAASIVPAVLQGIGMLVLPASPRWLVQRGRDEEARLVLLRIRKTQMAAEKELEDVQRMVQISRDASKTVRIWSREVRGHLVIGVGLTFMQQFIGHANVLSFAPDILLRAGLSESVSLLATVGLGTVKVVATIASMWLVDRTGRRPLLLCGSVAITFSLLAIAYAFVAEEGTPALAVAGLLAFVTAYALSWGPVGWLINSEIFPLALRGQAVGVSSTVNWASNLVVSASFLSLLDAAGAPATFALYALVSFASFLFLFHLLPETKGKSLEDVGKAIRLHPLLGRLI